MRHRKRERAARKRQAVSDQIVARGNRTPALHGLFNSARARTPWLYLDIDRDECMAHGVLVSDVFQTLQMYLGSYYVNNFNEFGRTWQVNVQADPQFRARVRDIRQLQVRNNQRQMLPLGTVLSVRHTSGPVSVLTYNMYSAAAVTGSPAPGTSSGQAIACMQDIELELGMRALAVPVTGDNDEIIAAISVSAASARVRAADLRNHFLPVLQSCARLLTMMT